MSKYRYLTIEVRVEYEEDEDWRVKFEHEYPTAELLSATVEYDTATDMPDGQ